MPREPAIYSIIKENNKNTYFFLVVKKYKYMPIKRVNSGILAKVEKGLMSFEARNSRLSAKLNPDLIQFISIGEYPNIFCDIP